MPERDSVPPRLFFLHVNKSGGTTLSRYLKMNVPQGACTPPDLAAGRTVTASDAPTMAHALAQYPLVADLHLPYPYLAALRILDSSYHAITLLREPIQRTISQVAAWRRAPDAALARMGPRKRAQAIDARTLSLAEMAEKHARRLHARSARMLAGIPLDEAVENEVELERCALDHLATFDAVGITEHLSEFADALAWLYAFPKPFPNLRLNVAPSPSLILEDERARAHATLVALNRADLGVYAEAQRRAFELQWRMDLARHAATTHETATAVLAQGATWEFHGLGRCSPVHAPSRDPIGPLLRSGFARFLALHMPVTSTLPLQIQLRLDAATSTRVSQGLEVRVHGQIVNARLSSFSRGRTITFVAPPSTRADGISILLAVPPSEPEVAEHQCSRAAPEGAWGPERLGLEAALVRASAEDTDLAAPRHRLE